MQGTVKWFSSDKGYGFITSNNGEDHYFNVRSIHGASLPCNGDCVRFESKLGKKGMRAEQVAITGKAQSTSSRIQQVDDRINCPNCNKKIVPRMIVFEGAPTKSVCPYCAATVKKFCSSSSFFSYVVWGLVIGGIGVSLFSALAS